VAAIVCSSSAASFNSKGVLHGVVRRLTIASAGAALLSSLLLLLLDVAPDLTAFVKHAWVAASALLLAGAACIGLASVVRARPKELIMRLSLGCAFILWGIQQLLDEGVVSAALGDIVIVLFVVDISAIVGSHRTPRDSSD
jgi:hypothetical protein